MEEVKNMQKERTYIRKQLDIAYQNKDTEKLIELAQQLCKLSKELIYK